MEKEEIDQTLRKNHDTMICSGRGIIILTVWLGVKALYYLAFANDNIFDSVLDRLSYNFDELWKQYLFIIAFVLFEGFLRNTIGIESAYLGKHRKNVPTHLIVFAWILTFYDTAYDILEIMDTIRFFSLSELFYCIFDAFFLFPLIELDISYIRIRKFFPLKEKMKQEEEEAENEL